MRIVVLVIIVLATVVAAPAIADEIRILSSRGGEVGGFIDLFEDVRKMGDRVVIDGPCLSACTLVLGVVPSNRICVTRRAVLGFHAARSKDRRGRLHAEPEATEQMTDLYPAPVRDWIRKHGGLTSKLLVLRGHELAGFYRVCK
jgi:hypothetical protein